VTEQTELLDLLSAGAAEMLVELQRPDDLTRRFNSLGFGGCLSPQDTARFQAATIASAQLVDDVPEGLRNSFDRVRKVHLYGVLDYDLFTIANHHVLLVMEGALRIRFLSYYESGMPVDKRGTPGVLALRTFDDVREAKSHGMKLRDPNGVTHPLPLGSKALFAWARRERLLPGTLTRGVDQALSNLRNSAAHPTTYTVLMPVHSAGTIRDVAEIINKLWGARYARGTPVPRPQAASATSSRTLTRSRPVDRASPRSGPGDHGTLAPLAVCSLSRSFR
jgi:hypothetical protein